jgi:hypothetical protein
MLRHDINVQQTFSNATRLWFSVVHKYPSLQQVGPANWHLIEYLADLRGDLLIGKPMMLGIHLGYKRGLTVFVEQWCKVVRPQSAVISCHIPHFRAAPLSHEQRLNGQVRISRSRCCVRAARRCQCSMPLHGRRPRTASQSPTRKTRWLTQLPLGSNGRVYGSF